MLPDNEKRLLIYKSNISKQNGSFIFDIFRSDKSIVGMDWGTDKQIPADYDGDGKLTLPFIDPITVRGIYKRAWMDSKSKAINTEQWVICPCRLIMMAMVKSMSVFIVLVKVPGIYRLPETVSKAQSSARQTISRLRIPSSLNF
jgi:hypothetical protein